MRIKIRPVVPGAVIRDPENRRVLPEDGAEVEETSFWTRRLLAGEVVRVDESSTPPRPTPRAGKRESEA
jgi:hypothetical protein